MDGIPVRVITTDQMSYLDFRRIDAAVVWDVTRIADRPFVPLIRDETFPVCSPDFLARHKVSMSEEGQIDLSQLDPNDFLHFSVGDSGFLTWRSYFTRAGLTMPVFGQPSPYDAYPFLMRAVLNGEGIALGWHGLVDDLLDRGDILRVGPSLSSRETSYYLQHRAITESSPAVVCLVGWCEAEAAKFRCKT
jgi:DNA-binding transcriptional LysR family regulator